MFHRLIILLFSHSFDFQHSKIATVKCLIVCYMYLHGEATKKIKLHMFQKSPLLFYFSLHLVELCYKIFFLWIYTDIPDVITWSILNTKVSGLSPSVLTNVFITGTMNVTAVCVLEGRKGMLSWFHWMFNKYLLYSSFYNVYRFKILQLQISTSLTSQEDFARVLFTSSVHLFIPKSVFYTQSIILSRHLIPQSVFYTQSAVRSTHPYFILTA